jgi:phenylpropionate dioxygenase-like ring-hydroxylating dioxygenase large terminal subunit
MPVALSGLLKSSPGRYDHLVRPEGLVHRSVYCDPEIFAEEMVKVFGASWVFLLHETEIPEQDDFKTITVGRRPTIVTRSADGRITALLNRCSHRGSMLCVEDHGRAKHFECPYHGWTFSNTGELLSVPYPKGYDTTFDPADQHLGRFPRIENYRGFVFGSLNPEVEPFLKWLGPAREVLDWSIDRDTIGAGGVKVVKGTQMTYRGNWKLQNDNNGDAYHAPFLHASTGKMNFQRYGRGKLLDHIRDDDSPMMTKYYGHGHKLLDQRPSIGSSWERARPVPGGEALAAAVVEKVGANLGREYLELIGRAGINLVLYPNLLIFGHGQFSVYEPVSVDATNVRWYTTLLNDAPEEINLLRLRFAEDFNHVAAPDDNEIFERMQMSLSTIPEMEWVNVSRGLGTDREVVEESGAVRGNIMDETGIRGSYLHWRELMNRDVRLALV